MQEERFGEAIRELGLAVTQMGGSAESHSALGHALAVSGDAKAARLKLETLTTRTEHWYVSPTLIARVHAGLGETEEALDQLNRAYEVRAADLVWLNVRPVFDSLRGNPRFSELLGKIGLPEV